MDLRSLKDLDVGRVNRIRAELESGLPFQAAHINLDDETDPSAILSKTKCSLTIVSDRHSYSNQDRIFPINQDENTVFAKYVFQDSIKSKYSRVADLCTGSGVIAMALAKAGAKEVVATDINIRSKGFIDKNNEINGLSVKFIESDLFDSLSGRYDKITINPPFMPAPDSTFPLHAQGGKFGVEKVVQPFFRECWEHINKGGCIQGVFHSFANDDSDTVLDLLKGLPKGWSYEICHVFPVKNVPVELYTTSFAEQKGYKSWISQIKKREFRYMGFARKLVVVVEVCGSSAV
ncbi:MAG: class I SAM-dependent methyltransferase, partial [Nanoarchaeota archaeon]